MKTMEQTKVAAIVCKLRLAGYKVHDLQSGWACEVDGLQVFAASNAGNGRYDVKINERIIRDV